MTTELVVLHDQCPRLATWSAGYALPAIPLAQAMHEALRAGLVSGDASVARTAIIATAAEPGLDINAWNAYELAMHHASMLEVICAYLLGDGGAWELAGDAFLLPDGRLRRVVLCSTWNTLRELEERQSWRTVAPVCETGRAMLINAIVIGNSRRGFRPTPWTQGFIHPENKMLRVKKREGKFNDGWSKVYRESTDKKPADWLTVMQQDDAFADLVFSVNVDVPTNRKEVMEDLQRIQREIEEKPTTMRRSGCYRFSPCIMARLCHGTPAINPARAGWKRR